MSNSPPPFLSPSEVRQDGLAFIGLCLSRYSPEGHSKTMTRQDVFDFNILQDREYSYVAATSDDGWLVGGGEREDSYKLPGADSAHVEIMRIGSFSERLGGLSMSTIKEKMQDGSILVPVMAVVPTAVVCNNDTPPEIEVRFDLEVDKSKSKKCYEWLNWQTAFLHNQLFENFEFPARFCPGPHHMTIVRKASFKSESAKFKYLSNCQEVVEGWRTMGPQVLKTVETLAPNEAGCVVSPVGDEIKSPGGVYLFRHRNCVADYFAPNFFPPYDTPEKIAIITKTLSKTWNPDTREFDHVELPSCSDAKEDVLTKFGEVTGSSSGLEGSSAETACE